MTNSKTKPSETSTVNAKRRGLGVDLLMKRPRVMLQAADRHEPAKIDAGSRGRLPAHGQIVCADVTNRCLSSATACLYGLSEAAILAARLSAGHWLPSPRQTAELRLRRRASNKQRTKDRDVGNTTSFRQSPFRSY
jgi:hypothetical protein